ncbi:SusC/RagA family TonB-linked outer membrane protein [Sphingobacterium olei]|uniref:SusC/RagA family TonB-linked outer membrane protein n=1 Tax=Sphingobacterium olei TaxID=2571155 RepID=A0A4U0P3T7_9SPHI|nr:SusC/RagA family TonB-linked outer membrane protein [Sphingobacterium olei]TJZ61975.1 SusC/RagA family TonB-linked outer membrane protein [Sphingobacterium olei]
MRRSLLFSIALGLVVSTDAYAAKVAISSNLSAADAYSPNRQVQNTVQGTVSGASGPLSGVTVALVGGTTSVSTDENGRFRISAPQGSILRFTYVGFKSQDVKVSSDNLNVVLAEEENSLEQVVVVGYGTQKRAHLTGAVSSVNADEVFGNRPIPDPARGLQGVIPGLNIRIPSGEVGSDPLLRIRGQVGSVRGNSQPLVLVDNVEVPSLQYVNANDIETVTVLKDAASTSIYGSKAAFGVVLITTKKGSKTETTEVTYSNNFVMQSPFKKIELAGIEGIEYSLDAHENMRQAGPAGGFWRIDRTSLERIREWQELYGSTVGPNDPVVYNRDWYWDGVQKFGVRIYDPVNAMIRNNAFSQIHNLSLNGRRGETSYNLGLGYVGQQGMMKAAQYDDYMRLNPSLRVSTKVNDFLTVRGGAMFAEARKRYPTSLNTGGFGADPWLYLYRWSRLFPIGVQENGEDIIDPAFSASAAPPSIKNDRFLNLNLGTTIDFTNNWNLVADYSYNSENTFNSAAVPYVQAKSTWYGVNAARDAEGNPIYVDEAGNVTEDGGVPAYEFPIADHTTKDNTYVSRGSLRAQRHTVNAFSTYNLNLGNSHELKFMAGTNIVAYDIVGHTSRVNNFLLNPDNPQFQFATGEQFVTGSNEWDSQVGFFGRFNYAFQDKYLFEANLRRDGSSRLSKNLIWQWFPSLSAGWVLSNESFMESLNPVLSFAKFRASWGSIGDQSIPNDEYVPVMPITQNSWIGNTGDRVYQLGTPASVQPDIAWQRIEHLNIGGDFRFFNNRLGLSADWFQRYTKNMIIEGLSVANTLGAVVPRGNYGDLRTRGWELAADYSHSFENGLRLTVNANISDATSITTRGADWNIAPEDRTLGSTFSTGNRYGDVFGYVTDRLYQKDDFLYDANGDFLTTTIIRNGTAKTVNVLAGDNPVYQTHFQDGGAVMMISPGDVKFKDLNGDGFIDDGTNTVGNPGDRVLIGNTTPRYEYGFRLGADFKGFDLSVFLQGVGKRSIWGSGQLAIPGWSAKEGAMPLAIASDYWREDRTDAFYPRAWHLGESDQGYTMRPQSRYMLDMSYLRVKNITFGYNVPANVLSRAKMKNARIYVSLENFITFDNLRGLPIDPEAISGYSSLRESNYNLGRTSTSNPAFKSASMGLQIGF